MTLTTPTPVRPSPPVPTVATAGPTGRKSGVRAAIGGGLTGALGVVPHVLHHVTFLAGTALVAGSGGTALFGAIGLIVSVPMLLRLRRRYGTWRAPAIGLAIFVGVFALSAFVIGPAISGSSGSSSPAVVDHSVHH